MKTALIAIAAIIIAGVFIIRWAVKNAAESVEDTLVQGNELDEFIADVYKKKHEGS